VPYVADLHDGCLLELFFLHVNAENAYKRSNDKTWACSNPLVPPVGDTQYQAGYTRNYADDDRDWLKDIHTQCCMINSLTFSCKSKGYGHSAGPVSLVEVFTIGPRFVGIAEGKIGVRTFNGKHEREHERQQQ
jgi:hypothetical protein